MDFKEFPHEGDVKYNIFASALFDNSKKLRNIIYMYKDGKAYDLQSDEVYPVGMTANGKFVMSGSIVYNFDGLIEVLIKEGKLSPDFDPRDSAELLLNEFTNTRDYKVSTLTTYFPVDFYSKPTYVDDGNKKEKNNI